MTRFALISALLFTTSYSFAGEPLQFNKTTYAYQAPQKLVKTCATAMKHRQAEAKKNGEPLDAEDVNPKTACLKVNIEQAKTNMAWVNDILNHDFTNADLKKDVEKWVADAIDDFSDPNHMPWSGYEYASEIEQISTSAQTIQFSRSYYAYTLGAHGNHSKVFLVLDLAKQKSLEVDDVLTKPSQKRALENLLYKTYIQYLKTGNGDPANAMTNNELKSHLEFWKFEMNNNFYFTPDGMTFSYSPYEAGPYAMGYIVLNLPKQALKGIIKEQYLNQKFSQFDDNNWREAVAY